MTIVMCIISIKTNNSYDEMDYLFYFLESFKQF